MHNRCVGYIPLLKTNNFFALFLDHCLSSLATNKNTQTCMVMVFIIICYSIVKSHTTLNKNRGFGELTIIYLRAMQLLDFGKRQRNIAFKVIKPLLSVAVSPSPKLVYQVWFTTRYVYNITVLGVKLAVFGAW